MATMIKKHAVKKAVASCKRPSYMKRFKAKAFAAPMYPPKGERIDWRIYRAALGPGGRAMKKAQFWTPRQRIGLIIRTLGLA